MYNEVTKFLVLHNHLALPGIGNITIETTPAQIDFANRSIVPPQKKILFSKTGPDEPGKLYSFLSYELKVDEEHAKLAFTGFVSQLRNNLDNNNSICFKGIGTLSKHESENIIFEPETLPAYDPELPAERVIRNVSHTVRVGEEEKTSEEMHTALNTPEPIKTERWWIVAGILAIIGIAAIAFYYFTQHHT